MKQLVEAIRQDVFKSHHALLQLEALCLNADLALTLIEGDPHRYAPKPCQTCETITQLVGRSFGCVTLSKQMH